MLNEFFNLSVHYRYIHRLQVATQFKNLIAICIETSAYTANGFILVISKLHFLLHCFTSLFTVLINIRHNHINNLDI